MKTRRTPLTLTFAHRVSLWADGKASAVEIAAASKKRVVKRIPDGTLRKVVRGLEPAWHMLRPYFKPYKSGRQSNHQTQREAWRRIGNRRG
jgi:hypothetical protein